MGIISTEGFQYRGVPGEFIISLVKESKFKTFIETGTHLGETVIWATQFFEKVVTIEASEEIYNGNNFSNYKNIDAYLGNSVSILPKTIRDDSIIYLDAHFSGGNTFNDNPLMKELEIINSSFYDNITIIVDDARYCMSKWNDDSYGSLVDIINLMCNNKKRHVVIFDDMVIAVPLAIKDLVDKYTNCLSKKYWNQFVEETTIKNKKNLSIKRIMSKVYCKIKYKLIN